MSDKPESLYHRWRNIPLASRTIETFLEVKRVFPTCPMCGTTTWITIDEFEAPGRLGNVLFAFPDYDIFRSQTLDAVIQSCTNCFYIRTFARAPITLWAMEQGIIRE